VQLGKTYEYSPQSVSNTTGDVAYNWTFGNGDNATGRTVSHAYESTGTYTIQLNASDDSRDTANASMVVDVVDAPIVESVNVSDETNENGIVAPGDTVEVVATVSGDATSVTANLSAFGANESVDLTLASGNTYNRTVAVDSNATDGEQSVTVTVTGSNSTDSAETGSLTVDTETLDVSLNDSRTVDVGEEVEYSPAAVNAAVGDVDYEWEFASSTVKSGKTVTYAFDSAATYEVVLTASDGSNDTASASMKVDVVSDSTVADTTTTSDSTDGGSTGGGSGGSGGSGGGGDSTTETTTALTTNESTQTPTSTRTVTENTQTATEEATATSETSDQTLAGGETRDDPRNPGDGQTPGEAPGFGAVAALVALAAAAGLALRE
jgi:PGF-CTERM protein